MTSIEERKVSLLNIYILCITASLWYWVLNTEWAPGYWLRHRRIHRKRACWCWSDLRISKVEWQWRWYWSALLLRKLINYSMFMKLMWIKRSIVRIEMNMRYHRVICIRIRHINLVIHAFMLQWLQWWRRLWFRQLKWMT